MEHHQMEQHMHYRSPRRRREREKGAEKIFESVMDEKFPNVMKDIYLYI